MQWALLIAGIVALISLAGGVLVFQHHTRALTRLLVEQGVSLARLLAVENADAVLLEDWVGIQMVAEGIDRERVVGYLRVTDQQGRVRGSTDPAGVDGQTHGGPQPGGQLVSELGDTRVYRVDWPAGPYLHFETPILFQQAEIGRIQLGLAAPSGQRVMLVLLILQSIALVLVTGFLTYSLAARLGRPLRIIGQALTELAWGRYECRIVENRRDDVGQIFNTFNRLAEFLQHSRGSSTIVEQPGSDTAERTVQFDVRTLKLDRSAAHPTHREDGAQTPPSADHRPR
jgi:serine/threonine-protein kinase